MRRLYSRVHKFLSDQKILSPNQYGFRKGCSTTLACFNLVKDVTENLNKRHKVCAIFLDMSKAFDYLSQEQLLYKLEKYGIRGVAGLWLKSYLENRQQMVHIDRIDKINKIKTTFKSKPRNNCCGLPQGSVMAPLLFITGINDLQESIDEQCYLFADDITILINDGKLNYRDYERKINKTLDQVINWMKNNNLHVNIQKTKLLQFVTYNKESLKFNIKYENNTVEEVECLKYLGITFDKNLNWKQHIINVRNTLDRFVFALRKIRLQISIESAKTAYFGYVSSVLSYGLVIWGNSVHMINAFKTQKKCIRAICNITQMQSCKPLFKSLNILTLPCMYIKAACLFVLEHPNYFKTNAQQLDTKNRHASKLYVPQCRLAMAKRNAFHMCITIFNKLPNTIKALPINKFKSQIQKWLIMKCFYSVEEYLCCKENAVNI